MSEGTQNDKYGYSSKAGGETKKWPVCISTHSWHDRGKGGVLILM